MEAENQDCMQFLIRCWSL